jgi:hypothetical protein
VKDKRTTVRRRRRLLVRFDRTSSFTIDVSAGGFSLGAMQVLPVSTMVEGWIQVEGTQVPFSGRVAWNSPGYRRMNLSGKMGVTFTHPVPEFARLLESSGAALRQVGT